VEATQEEFDRDGVEGMAFSELFHASGNPRQQAQAWQRSQDNISKF
jgi:hypothetical protein